MNFNDKHDGDNVEKVQVEVGGGKERMEEEESWISPRVPVTKSDHLHINIIMIMIMIVVLFVC